MKEAFSEQERLLLSPYFTSVTSPVFGLKLPQEVAGALFSRYSRSEKSLRRIFLEEFLGPRGLSQAPTPQEEEGEALKKARAFYERVLVGYGDDSIAQLGGAHIACEGVSNIAAKLLEDSRIGLAPLEKSTRYVRFDTKDASGDYPFYKEPQIMASPYRDAYLRVMGLLFETYSGQMAPMMEWVQKNLPITSVEWKHPQTGEPLTYQGALKDEKLRRWAERAYRSTIRAHACDVLRSYLPAATLTNVGLFGTGQAFEHLLNKLYSHPLTEARKLAEEIHRALNLLSPAFVRRAGFQSYLAETERAISALAEGLLGSTAPQSTPAVTLVDWDQEAEEKIIAAILYPHCRHPLGQLREIARRFSPEQRRAILEEYLKRRRHRRDKPGRALEQVYYTFDLVANLGIYRDLQRHRLLTQQRQPFTTAHGYVTPREIEEAGFSKDFQRCMEESGALYEKIYRDFPQEAQYVVPFAFRVRWYMKLNLREAVHIGELRTLPQGHPDYRLLVQEMWKKIGEVHPTLARVARFMDWGTYRLGRLQSEMRTEYKKALQENNL